MRDRTIPAQGTRQSRRQMVSTLKHLCPQKIDIPLVATSRCGRAVFWFGDDSFEV
jgi:hypothetical protein